MEFFRKRERQAPKIDLDNLYFGRSSATFLRALRTFPILYSLTHRQLEKQVIDDLKNGNCVIHKELYKAYCDNLKKAVDSVFSDGNPPEFDSKYFDMRQQFLANVSRFASCKAYRVTQLLQQNTDSETVQKAILNTYNRYQVAEYNTAVARARTAKQWNDFNDDPVSNKLYPNIKWIPSRSATPREEHRMFWNKVWAKDDPFWSQNQPGNLWECKCDWEVTDEPATGGTYNCRPPAGLEGNPAETGEIFTDKASYFEVLNKQKTEIECERVVTNTLREKTFARINDTMYENKTVKEHIYVVWQGLKEAFNQPHENFEIKNQYVSVIDTIIPRLEFESLPPKDKAKSNGIYRASISIKGKHAYVILKRRMDGKTIFYSITDKKFEG